MTRWGRQGRDARGLDPRIEGSMPSGSIPVYSGTRKGEVMDRRMKRLMAELQEVAKEELARNASSQREEIMERFDGDSESERIVRALTEADYQFSQLVLTMKSEEIHPLILTILGAEIEHNHDKMTLIMRIDDEKLKEWEPGA